MDKDKLKRLLQQPEFEGWENRNETCDPGKHHDPSEVLERNAAFLIESSHKISGYDEITLSRMEQNFELGNYSTVIDLAYYHDRKCRGSRQSSSEVSVSISHLDRVKHFVSNVLSFLQ